MDTTDPFIYQVVRTYNLMSKRDIMYRYDSYIRAQTTMQTLNKDAEGTSYRYIIESKPRRQKASK